MCSFGDLQKNAKAQVAMVGLTIILLDDGFGTIGLASQDPLAQACWQEIKEGQDSLTLFNEGRHFFCLSLPTFPLMDRDSSLSKPENYGFYEVSYCPVLRQIILFTYCSKGIHMIE